jgi:DNA-binding MarR family transcriptional regulator
MTESTVAGSMVDSGRQLLPLIDHLARVGRRAADTCGAGCLRPRHLIALKLLGERGPLTQHALGSALSLDPSNVVGLLNELEERDLIARRRDPADRRRHIVELSDSGSAELARAYREFGAVEDDLFKMLTAGERATLYTLLSRAVAALAPAPACAATECAAEQAELRLFRDILLLSGSLGGRTRPLSRAPSSWRRVRGDAAPSW